MPYYRRMGEIPRKRHQRFTSPDGALYAEELFGQEGFTSDSSLLYHRHLPTALLEAEPIAGSAAELTPNVPLVGRHFRTTEIAAAEGLAASRTVLLANDDLAITFLALRGPTELLRDTSGDRLTFVVSGSARLESVFGVLDVVPGDYVVVPESTIHRWVPDSELRALVIESDSHVRPPRRYLTERGQLLETAPYCERDLRAPAELVAADGEADVLVRHAGGWTRHRYLHHPFDVVGWDGCCYPYALSIHDFEPLVKRFHAPPPVHQTFEARGFVVCSFCPRPYDFDESAVPIPYNHINADADEVLFYVDGEYVSRAGSGVGIGSVTLHPAGFLHGPQPGSLERLGGRTSTSELAVMVDTVRPLLLGAGAQAIEDREYAWSWAKGEQPR